MQSGIIIHTAIVLQDRQLWTVPTLALIFKRPLVNAVVEDVPHRPGVP